MPDGVTHPCKAGSSCVVPIMNVPKDTASFSLNYLTNVMGDYQFSAHIVDAYVGTAYDVAYYFAYKLPGYNIANGRIGLARGNWSTNLFVDNLTNKQALITREQHQFSVQHSAGGALFHQPTAHLRGAVQLQVVAG